MKLMPKMKWDSRKFSSNHSRLSRTSLSLERKRREFLATVSRSRGRWVEQNHKAIRTMR